MNIETFHSVFEDPLQFDPHLENILVLVKIEEGSKTQFQLKPSESEKALKFRYEKDQLAYKWRHHLLNTWLSHYDKTSVNNLTFIRSDSGKISITGNPFYFNISRSFDYLAFAFGPSEIGVDIETIKDVNIFLSVADQHFHDEERKVLNENLSAEMFFSVWTRKEALLKSCGTGLNDELNLIDTTLDNHNIHSKNYQIRTFDEKEFVVSIAYASDKIHPLHICNYNISSLVSFYTTLTKFSSK